jgi:hypothetical protein
MNVEEISIDSSDFSDPQVDSLNDTTYVVDITAEATNLSVSLKLDAPVPGSIITGILSSETVQHPQDSSVWVKAISIEASGELGDAIKSADIIIPYNEDSLGGLSESSLLVMWLNDSTNEWTPINYTVDYLNNLVIAHTEHLSVFGVFARPSMESLPGMPRKWDFSIFYNRINGFVEINYQPPDYSYVRIEVYNCRGFLIKRFENVLASPKYQMTSWNASSVNNGVYYIKLTTGKFSALRKIIIF